MSAHDWPEYLEVVKGIDGCDIGLSKEEYIFARNAINDRDELERKIILAEQQRDTLQQRCEELVEAARFGVRELSAYGQEACDPVIRTLEKAIAKQALAAQQEKG